MRKSEIGTLLLTLPYLIGAGFSLCLRTFERGHMTTMSGLIAVALEVGGLLILRFLLPAFITGVLLFTLRRSCLDLRAKIHLAAAIFVSIAAWTIFQVPK